MSASPRKNVASKGVERIDHYIDSLDPGIRLHLREKRPEGKKKFEDQATLLIVHGRMAPGPVAYDLPVPGYSWMDYIASRGFDVFALSIRGFGESTWPQEMHVSPRGKPPAIPGKVAVKDIKAAVDFICEQRGLNKLSVLGRSWGTTTGPAYAADNMSQVQKLVLYAPYYSYDNPETDGRPPKYRGIRREARRLVLVYGKRRAQAMVGPHTRGRPPQMARTQSDQGVFSRTPPL